MPLRAFLLLFGASAIIASANTLVFNSPDPSVFGDSSQFAIFSVSLSQVDNLDWELKVQTNYPGSIPGFFNGTPYVVPPVLFANGHYYTISDFLIHWNNADYGIVLGPHDGYDPPGNLYLATTGLQTSGSVTGGDGDQKRLTLPVYLAAGATFEGASTSLTGVHPSTATFSTGYYTITDDFQAPAGFLLGSSFSFTMSSYPCANSVITGTGEFTPLPEPGTVALAIPALLLFGYGLARKGRRAH
jgi:hypothetical protein